MEKKRLLALTLRFVAFIQFDGHIRVCALFISAQQEVLALWFPLSTEAQHLILYFSLFVFSIAQRQTNTTAMLRNRR